MATQTQRSDVLIVDKTHATQRLRHTLDVWISIISEYNQRWANYRGYGDCLYFFNETATVSTLGGAVWRSGGQALCEFGQAKKVEGKEINGRSDFWFMLERYEYWCEAKQKWPALYKKTGSYRGIIENGLEKAEKDVIKLGVSTSRYEKSLGLLFLIPTLSSERYPDADKLVEFFVSEICGYDNDIAFCAYTFPEKYPRCKWIYEGGGTEVTYYPGVCLLGKYF